MRRRLLREYLTIVRIARNRLLRGGHRGVKVVQGEYSTLWSGKDMTPWIRGESPELLVQDGVVTTARRVIIRKEALAILYSVIEAKNPSSILEVGSGLGINLYCAALRFPHLQCEGIELTEAGVLTAFSLPKNLPLSLFAELTDLDVATVSQRLSLIDINFQQGDMRRLPYPDRSIDMSFTFLSIEQLGKDALVPIREIRRVTKSSSIFFEAFKEAQTSIFQSLYLWGRDYFRESYRFVLRQGFSLTAFKPLRVHKIRYAGGAHL